jgi:LysM repeat protein
MGRKKKAQQPKETVLLSKHSPKSIDSFAAMAQELKLNESYKSLLLGVAVVMLVAVLVVGYAKNRNIQNTQTTKQVAAMKVAKAPESLATHTIVAGDDLKTISLKYYETADLFLLIAKANNIQNPDAITEGEVLTIPKVDKKEFTPSLVTTASKEPFSKAS